MVKDRETIKNAHRIVVKVGTSLLTYDTGKLNLAWIEKLVRVLSDLHNQGKEVILVSSGAIGVGMAKIGMSAKPDSISGKQAMAAIGQSMLMHEYDKMFSEYGKVTAQILITKDVLIEKIKKKNAKKTFKALLDYGVIPVVNENDTVATDEIEVGEIGDNDTLSAIVAKITEADLLILLTDIEGLYTDDPRRNAHAKLIHEVLSISEEIENGAHGAGTDRGTGGMRTKLSAAKIVTCKGIPMVIISGRNPKNIYKVIDGEDIGTIFLPKKEDRDERSDAKSQ